MSSETYSTVIIGSGPAGHTAGIYLARAGFKPIMFEGFLAGGIPAGGQLTTTTEIENFPGFPDGIMGSELMDRMRAQSAKYGTEIITETISSVDFSTRPFSVMTEDGVKHTAWTIIIATGATAKKLPFEGSEEFWQHGISACATCDGSLPIFRNKPVVVIGGGDTAMEEALHLTKFASKVIVVHRRDAFRASKAMQARLLANPKVEVVWDSEVIKATGTAPPKQLLSEVVVKNVKTGQETKIPCSGVFFAIGHTPNTAFLNKQLATDDLGYLVTIPGTCKTSIEGVFACGDVQDHKFRQAIVAAGSGCMAALECENFLTSINKVPSMQEVLDRHASKRTREEKEAEEMKL
eukprot:TRINITY_DN1761_c0_g1_i1.p1 TRINITY_DN1761_c0_g1~~TRINITY_DN1761_c0_g1_i1.p1  ORF type:complete len:350 (+),score=92.71 TRINITY_DN1761_c0_g1_i1:128-1177(+)